LRADSFKSSPPRRRPAAQSDCLAHGKIITATKGDPPPFEDLPGACGGKLSQTGAGRVPFSVEKSEFRRSSSTVRHARQSCLPALQWLDGVRAPNWRGGRPTGLERRVSRLYNINDRIDRESCECRSEGSQPQHVLWSAEIGQGDEDRAHAALREQPVPADVVCGRARVMLVSVRGGRGPAS